MTTEIGCLFRVNVNSSEVDKIETWAGVLQKDQGSFYLASVPGAARPLGVSVDDATLESLLCKELEPMIGSKFFYQAPATIQGVIVKSEGDKSGCVYKFSQIEKVCIEQEFYAHMFAKTAQELWKHKKTEQRSKIKDFEDKLKELM